MVRQTAETGSHQQLILIPELDIMVHVVLKWIFGKPTLWGPKSPLTHALLKVTIDAKVLNVVISLLEKDIKEFVIKMAVILILID